MRYLKLKSPDLYALVVVIIVLFSTSMPRAGYSQIDDVNLLIQQLKDQDPQVHQQAVQALLKVGEPAIDPLMAMLKNGDKDDRNIAAIILGNLLLANIWKPVTYFPSLITFLNEEQSLVPAWAGLMLIKMGESSVEPLIVALQDTNSNISPYIPSILGELKDPRAIGPLIAAFKYRNVTVKSCAADALGQIGLPAVEPLIAALKAEKPEVRQWEVRALMKIGPLAVEALITLLADTAVDVRMKAGWALSEIDDPRAAEALVASMDSKDVAVVAGAYRFFISKGEKGCEDLLERALDEHGNFIMAQDFINSGNDRLASAGSWWANKRGYTIKTSSFAPGGPTWGSRR